MQNDWVVHVVDDDAAVRQSLAFLLATAGIPVRVHESAVSFLKSVGDDLTGGIVTDVRMPDIDGIEFMRRLDARGIKVPVIVMTGHADVPLAVEAMKQGAMDFIEKPFDDDILLAAVRAMQDRQERTATQDTYTTGVQARLRSLSERERQVLDGLVAGKPNKIIAHDLGISPRTIEIYRANVMAKMQATSLSALVRMALLAGAEIVS